MLEKCRLNQVSTLGVRCPQKADTFAKEWRTRTARHDVTTTTSSPFQPSKCATEGCLPTSLKLPGDTSRSERKDLLVPAQPAAECDRSSTATCFAMLTSQTLCLIVSYSIREVSLYPANYSAGSIGHWMSSISISLASLPSAAREARFAQCRGMIPFVEG